MVCPLENAAGHHQAVLDDRAETERRKEGQRADDQDHAEQARRQRSARSSETSPARRPVSSFAAKLPGDGQHGEDHTESADEHRGAEGQVVEERVGVQPGEGAAVVVRRRGDRRRGFRSARAVPGCSGSTSPVARLHATAEPRRIRAFGDRGSPPRPTRLPRPGSSCRDTPACARPSVPR